MKPVVRQAGTDDFEAVYPLLRELNDSRLGQQEWRRLFTNHWQLAEFSPGLMLQAGETVVGFLGTVYSRQHIGNRSVLCCNLTSWIVRDEYRSHSIMLLLPLLRKKDLLLTSYSSNDVTYALYKKLGFKDACPGKRVVLPFFSLYTSRYQITDDTDVMAQYLTSAELQLAREHAGFGNCCLLMRYQHQYCLLMAVRRKRKLKIYYVSHRAFFQQHLSGFRSGLMRYCGVNRLIVDECLLEGKKVILSLKKAKGNPYQYKTGLTACPAPAPLYSELFLLNM